MYSLTAIRDASLDNIKEIIKEGDVYTCSDAEYLLLERAGRIRGTNASIAELEDFTAVYVGGNGGGGGGSVDSVNASDGSLNIAPTTGNVNARVKISSTTDNALSLKEDGLFVEKGATTGGVNTVGSSDASITVSPTSGTGDVKVHVNIADNQGNNALQLRDTGLYVAPGDTGGDDVLRAKTVKDKDGDTTLLNVVSPLATTGYVYDNFVQTQIKDSFDDIVTTVSNDTSDILIELGEDNADGKRKLHSSIRIKASADKENYEFTLLHKQNDNISNVLDMANRSFCVSDGDAKTLTGVKILDNGILRFSTTIDDDSANHNDIFINPNTGKIDGDKGSFVDTNGLFNTGTPNFDRTGTWGVIWDDDHTWKWTKIDGSGGGEDLTAVKSWEYDGEGLDIPRNGTVLIEMLKSRFKLANGLETSLNFPRKGDIVEVLINGSTDLNYICYVHQVIDQGSPAMRQVRLVVQNVIENG